MTRRTTWSSFFGFVILAYGITWLAWLPGLLQHRSIFSISMPLTYLGGMGPALAAVIVTAATEGVAGLRWLGRRLVQWRVRAYWYPVVLLLPLACLTLAMGADKVRTGVFPGFLLPAHNSGILSLIPPLLSAFVMQTLMTGGNEELGWRGYALPALQARFSALTSTFILALIWALWHLPLFLMQGTSQSHTPFHLFLLFTVPLTTLFTWVHNQTGGSILMVMLLHGAFNTTVSLVRFSILAPANIVTFLVLAVAVVTLAGPRRFVRRQNARLDAA